MITLLHRGNARADIDDDTRALMPENGREDAFRIGARKREIICMAKAGGLDLDQNLARLRTFKLNIHDFKWFAGLNSHSRAYIHRCYSRIALLSRRLWHVGSIIGKHGSDQIQRIYAMRVDCVAKSGILGYEGGRPGQPAISTGRKLHGRGILWR